MRTLLFLHGALGNRHEISSIQRFVADKKDNAAIDFYGHGGSSVDQPFTIELFAQQILNWMDKNQHDTIDLFGYSMGGYVALYLALHFPGRIGRVITLGTKLQWNEMIAANETRRLNPIAIQQKVPQFAQHLQHLHGPNNWVDVLEKTAAMLTEMGRFNPIPFHQFNELQCPVLLMVGDRDKQVSLVETETVYKQLALGQLAVLPNTAHPLDGMDYKLVADHINRFLGM